MTLTTFLSASAALAAVLAAVVLGGRVARLTRLGRRHTGGPGRLALVDSLSLDPRRRLLLVRCDGRCAVLLTGQQDLVVGWLPEPSP